MSYYNLNEEVFARVKEEIETLRKHEDFENLNTKSQEFVVESYKRLSKYGRSLSFSAGQQKWLTDLYKQIVRGEPREYKEEDVLDRLDRYNDTDRRRRF